MQKLVFATANPHKLREVQQILPEYIVLSLSDIGFDGDITEDAETLEGNALLKAKFVYEKFGLNCFADDTGLETEALGGRPGVHSARYAGEHKSPAENLQKLLDELKPHSNRNARFRTVIALIMNGKEYFFEGIVDGTIIEYPRGKEGFGYDPVFKPQGYHETFAQMPLHLKNQISHRARAVQKLTAFLKEF